MVYSYLTKSLGSNPMSFASSLIISNLKFLSSPGYPPSAWIAKLEVDCVPMLESPL
jgi:hypothetical protein